MNGTWVPVARWTEGAVAAAVVGAAGANVLTSSAVTAETGRAFWLLAVIFGGAVGPMADGGLRSRVTSCLPFVAAVYGVMAWTGATRLALRVADAILLHRTAIPMAGWSERDMAFRYGLLFLFVLVASPPACLAAAIAWRWLGRALDAATGLLPGAPVLREALPSLWRWGISGLAATIATHV